MLASTPPVSVLDLLHNKTIRDSLVDLLSRQDLCHLRLASSSCSHLITAPLFRRTWLTFSATSFTKPYRLQALSQIAHHIEHLILNIPHSTTTFLPPLINPEDGHEISFLYAPHTSVSSVTARPKYANTALGEVLTQQYPPLFHAATNVPSFIHAFSHMTNLRHLTVRCPGQDPRERYRRNTVDYALISLRIALERAPLHRLNKLSLCSMHPAAFHYLRHMPGIGSVPSAHRRWRQIKKLHISVDAWDFYGDAPGLDHLKIIDDYIRVFAPHLEKLSFSWIGQRGPCPIALAGDPLFAPPPSSKKLFNELTSLMSPLPASPPRKPMSFPKIKYLHIGNAGMNTTQLSELVATHRSSAKEFDFEDVVLTNNGSWDEALAPLMETMPTSSRNNGRSTPSRAEVVWCRSSINSLLSNPASANSDTSLLQDDLDCSSPSAAAQAASLELLNIGLGLGISSGMQQNSGRMSSSSSSSDFDGQDGSVFSSMGPSASVVSFRTRLVKKRVHHRRQQQQHHQNQARQETSYSPPPTPESITSPKLVGIERRPSLHQSLRDHLRNHTKSPVMSRMREDLAMPINKIIENLRGRMTDSHGGGGGGADDDDDDDGGICLDSNPANEDSDNNFYPAPLRTKTPSPRARTARPASPSLSSRVSSEASLPFIISPPIIGSSAQPVLLQPAVYNPHSGGSVSSKSSNSSFRMGAAVATTTDGDEGISSVQRNLEQEETHRRMAEDATMRAKALRRAKEAVLTKLSQEFGRKGSWESNSSSSAGGLRSPPESPPPPPQLAKVLPAMYTPQKQQQQPQQQQQQQQQQQTSPRAAAALLAKSKLSHSTLASSLEGGFPCMVESSVAGCGPSFTSGARFREALFATSGISVLPDQCRAMDSQSALVPLMFSRT